jgi:hypothetical protein
MRQVGGVEPQALGVTTQLTPNWRPTQTQHQDDREQLADAWADDCVEAERELEREGYLR